MPPQGFAKWLAIDGDAVVRQRKAIIGNQGNHRGEQLMFKRQKLAGQCVFVIASFNRQYGLRNDGATIQFCSDVMHAGAMFRITRLQCAAVRMQAAIFRQQGWVDIDHPAHPGFQRIAIDDAHETGEYQ